MTGLTDVHQHLLWGIDDGPKDAKTMHAMLHAAQEQSIHRIYATPHACPGYRPFDMDLYRERLQEAQAYCRDHALDVDVRCGAEIAWTYHTVLALKQGRLPTLGDTDCVLIELWPDVSWQEVHSCVEQTLRAGYLPLLAHIERYRCFVGSPKEAMRLKERTGVCYQINAASVLRSAFFRRRFIHRMLSEQAIDAVASDAHNCESRPQLLGAAHEALTERCGAAYADALVNFSEVLR